MTSLMLSVTIITHLDIFLRNAKMLLMMVKETDQSHWRQEREIEKTALFVHSKQYEKDITCGTLTMEQTTILLI